MLEWKNVLELVGSSLGSSASDCVLDFLRVLPEEVTEGRKINLTVCGTETPQPLDIRLGNFASKNISI